MNPLDTVCPENLGVGPAASEGPKHNKGREPMGSGSDRHSGPSITPVTPPHRSHAAHRHAARVPLVMPRMLVTQRLNSGRTTESMLSPPDRADSHRL